MRKRSINSLIEKIEPFFGYIKWYRSFIPNLSLKIHNIIEKIK